MICPKCKAKIPNPISVAGGKVGGAAKVAKGFSITGQPSAESRARAWTTRRTNAKKEKRA